MPNPFVSLRPYKKKVVCRNAQSSIVFSGIPSGYSNINLTLNGRASTGTLIANWLMINGDSTAANYDINQELQGSSTSATAAIETTGVLGITAGVFTGPTSDILAVGLINILIGSYCQATFPKTFIATSVAIGGTAGNANVRIQGGRWRLLTPIHSVRLSIAAGSYVDDTTAVLELR